MFDTTSLTRFARHRRLFVGLSGGLDSIVLLHALSTHPDLFEKLHAVHVHHGLSPHADAWQAHCEAFCETHRIPLTVRLIKLEQQSNLEEAAREARFDVFKTIMQANDCLVLAHHKDDQAETLLLRLLRGAGVEGLAAMQAYRVFENGHVARPLLHQSKQALEHYAKAHALVWVEDESNQDLKFSRNYVRHDIMPRLQQAWPRAIESISSCAQHCQEAQANLDDLAYLDCPELALKQDKLRLTELRYLPLRRLKQVLRVWFKNQGVKVLSAVRLEVLIQQVIFATSDAMPLLQIGKLTVRRYQEHVYLVRDIKKAKPTIINLPGLRIPTGAQIDVRFRVGGEKLIWHGQTKSLKSLFQIWGVPPWERDTIPLIFIENKLVAVLDFAIGDDYYEPSSDGRYNLTGACVYDTV